MPSREKNILEVINLRLNEKEEVNVLQDYFAMAEA